MPITNPISITYGSLEVGGSTGYQIHGPYVIDKSYQTLRLVFDVVVAGTDLANMVALADTLEDGFRTRLTTDDVLKITVDSDTTWTYTQGSTLLNCTASIAKSGNPEVDHAASRSYTVSITADLPADATADAGLRDIQVQVHRDAARRRTVSVRGTFTATDSGHAQDLYDAAADTVAQGYLDLIGPSATWELVDEGFDLDRNKDGSDPHPNVCNFSQQWVELLVDQSQSGTDDTDIRDHRIVFTRLSSYPGSFASALRHMERVICSYDCAIDIDETTDLQGTFDDKVRPHVLSLFQANFDPAQFAVEEQRASFDESAKRMSVSMQVIYVPGGSSNIVEVSQSVAYREQRHIDYTPTHDPDELSMEADVGWATVERVWTRSAIALGHDVPRLRIGQWAPNGIAGPISSYENIRSPDESNASNEVRRDGWNIISSTSQVTPSYIGMPDDTQIQVTALTETVIERFHRRPGNGTNTGI